MQIQIFSIQTPRSAIAHKTNPTTQLDMSDLYWESFSSNILDSAIKHLVASKIVSPFEQFDTQRVRLIIIKVNVSIKQFSRHLSRCWNKCRVMTAMVQLFDDCDT